MLKGMEGNVETVTYKMMYYIPIKQNLFSDRTENNASEI